MPRDTIVLLGVNHKTTPLAVREKLALSSGYEAPLKDLGQLDGLSEYYLLSTCNRVELYSVTVGPSFDQLEAFIADIQDIHLSGLFCCLGLVVWQNKQTYRN